MSEYKREYDLDDIDKALGILINLRGMLGAIGYLINPNEIAPKCPVKYFEDWIHDMGNRLDEAIEIL